MKFVKLGIAVALLGAITFACGSDSGNSRTVEVDYRSDDFAGLFLGYFPREITVTPGMTVNFHQTWTGEPHSVTMGKIVDEGYAPLKKYLDGTLPIPDEEPEEYDPEIWEERLPFMFGEEGVNQSAALPCFLPKESDMPDDFADPCAKKFRATQPEFDGSQAYYSSGFIPFEGELANEFELKIAEDTPDGTYAYYCNLHHVLMSGEITVKRGAKVESQGDMNRRGAKEAREMMSAARVQWDKEKRGEGDYELPLAGSGNEAIENEMGSIVEFTPRTINAKVGEKVTWTFISDHTITFNVPPYTPLFQFDKRGYLEFNEDLDRARGGWPGAPESSEEEGEGPEERAPFNADAGEWDGSGGIHSSGTGWETGDTFSVTFTKAGTYPYACLIHPGQIGKVVVS